MEVDNIIIIPIYLDQYPNQCIVLGIVLVWNFDEDIVLGIVWVHVLMHKLNSIHLNVIILLSFLLSLVPSSRLQAGHHFPLTKD